MISTRQYLFLSLIAPAVVAGQGIAARDINGWRSATWGMTPEQVLSAFPEALRLPKPDVYSGAGVGNAKLYGRIGIDDFDLAGVRMKVRFVFSADSGKLVAVSLQEFEDSPKFSSDDNYYRIEKLVTEKYGPRTSGHEARASLSTETTTLEATWVLSRTVIELGYFFMPGIVQSTTLWYRPVNKKARDAI